MATGWTLGYDAADPHRLAAFWVQALGYIPEPGYDDPDGASIIDPDGKCPLSTSPGFRKARPPRTGCTLTSKWPERRRGTCPRASHSSAPKRTSSLPPERHASV